MIPKVRLVGTLAATLLLAPAHVAFGQPPRAPSPPIVGGAPNGRYVIVNGTPELTRNIMLLDTVTGRTWIICTVDGTAAWCFMPTTLQAEKSQP